MMGSPRPAAAPDVRRLRRQLAVLVSGIEDLEQEWDATIELARHLRAQRQHRGQNVDVDAVIADLQVIMRASAPLLPDYVPKLTTVEELVPAIEKAQKRYDDLIGQHLGWARTALDQDAE